VRAYRDVMLAVALLAVGDMLMPYRSGTITVVA
jgi:hypothetical protein